MGKRGDGYGSEDYFLKNRTTRCEEFDCALLSAMDAADCKLEWMYPTGARGEREPQGLTFLKDKGTLALWSKYWPQRGRAQTWDGVAKLHRAPAPNGSSSKRRRILLNL